MDAKQKARELIKKRRHLLWSTKNYDKLSEKSIVESILNYGNWEDYLSLEKILGVGRISKVFKKLKSKKRVNLRPQTINYFSKYFDRYG